MEGVYSMVNKIKQNNSSSCFVCGINNSFGLKTRFYEINGKFLISISTTMNEHQGYPGVVHGGITAAILDEAIGRAIYCFDKGAWGVTADLSITYKHPVPLNQTLYSRAKITDNKKRIFYGEGELFLEDGTILALGKGKYMRVPVDKIGGEAFVSEEWFFVDDEEEPFIPEFLLNYD